MESVEMYDEVDLHEDNAPTNPPPRSSALDYLWSLLAAILIVMLLLMQEPAKLSHWMLLPLVLCGTLIGADAIRWLTGKYALFDPKGIVGLYGFNYFFIAPLLIVFYEMQGVETYTITDWHPRLGVMAIFNVAGLIIYKIFGHIALKRPSKAQTTYWSLNAGKATVYTPLFCAIAFISLCIYVTRAGGMSGVLLQEGQSEMIAELKGFGVIMILRDALPMATLILLTVIRMTGFYQEKSRTWLFVMVSILILFFITSGLRGSRAATGLGLICAGGIIHYFWRRLTIPMVLLSLIPLALFFYVYGFYKSAGIVGIKDLLSGQISIQGLQERTHRTFTGMLIGDLSRAHIQAAELDVLANKPWPYEYRYGTTYLSAMVSLVPRQIWPSKPLDTSRIIAGTEMLYGPGSYSPIKFTKGGGSRSTQLYGLAGEAILNFGVWGILPAFAVWGFIVGKMRKRTYSYRAGDMRLIMSGFWFLFGFVMITSDADQFVWFFTSLYIIPATLVFLISDKIKLDIY